MSDPLGPCRRQGASEASREVGGARLRVRQVVEVADELSRLARAIGPNREELCQ
jgi:hypothetical protein